MVKRESSTSKYHIWRIPSFVIMLIVTLLVGVLTQIDYLTLLHIKQNPDSINFIQNVFTVLLAATIGCIIGWERETRNRPAGLRTYSLVCVGAAIVMITSFEILKNYSITNFDPTRLGAQVISGIGFLGAGTIIRDHFSVKGLTTAASLWAVGCIGLTIGSRMYALSLVISFVVYYVLHNLRSLEELKNENMNYELAISVNSLSDQFQQIQQLLYNYSRKKVEIIAIKKGVLGCDKSIEIGKDYETSTVIMHIIMGDHNEQNINKLVMELYCLKSIVSVSVKELE